MRTCLWGLLLSALLPAQNIETIRETAVTSLFSQPNYTCLETIDRRHEVDGVALVEDKVRLEVAIIDGKEMFAWPGDTSFGNEEVVALVRTGLFASGNFGIYPRMLFFGTAAKFTAQGEEKIGGRGVVRHDFAVAKEASGFHMQHRDADVTVGFHGSIFTDAATSELVRLIAIADAIPAQIGITSAQDQVDYGHVRFGDQSFLLPLASESQITRKEGLDRSRVQFSKCSRYGGESRILFDDQDESGPQTADASRRETALPMGTELQLSIANLDLESAAIGDRVNATLLSDIKQGKQVLVPKGAKAVGRVTKLNRYAKQYRLTFGFQTLEWAGGSARLKAQIKSSKSAKAELDPSGDLLVARPTPKLSDLPLVWKVVP